MISKQDKRIVVLGATGRQGGQVVRHLMQDGWQVRGLTRTPESRKAAALRETGVEVLQGDFSEQRTLERLLAMLDGGRADLVLSDMAPNTMGIAEVDHARSMHLVVLATDFAAQALRPGGDLLLKVFQGREFQPLVARLRQAFETVKLRKPKASRGRSPEVYVLARGYRLV